mmetsp:Transcript_1841/g.3235  ORF Transcript_1841/g.3235 Transcript_1841/m.3235 type:complete len:169 (-) Transcript_1841:189-695(-)
MAVAPLRLPLSASRGLITEAVTPRCLNALTPKGVPRVASFHSGHSGHEPTTPKTPISCCSPSVAFSIPMSSSAAGRLLNNSGMPSKFSVPDNDACVPPLFNDSYQNEFPCLLGRAPMAGAPLDANTDVVPHHRRRQRRVTFNESETQLAMNARDAFLARQRRIGTRGR